MGSPVERAHSKFEARKPNFGNKSKFSKFKYFFLCLQFLAFEFVSDFDIRILDFPMSQTCLVLIMPG